uniref:SAM_MT_RSMB_NOP domain-containing protein n=1 Tax=Caenorhabditis tropicalis TaxID=1561998 RepID=A0A1I7TQF5_9PELO
MMREQVEQQLEQEEPKIIGFNEDQYADSSDSDDGVNEFKAVFKKYKKRRPPPDFSEVIDVKSSPLLNSRHVFKPTDITPEKAALAEKLGLIHPSEWRVFSFPDRSGLYLLPGLLKKEMATVWLKRAFKYANPPNITNLTLHGKDVERYALASPKKPCGFLSLTKNATWIP